MFLPQVRCALDGHRTANKSVRFLNLFFRKAQVLEQAEVRIFLLGRRDTEFLQ